MKKGIDVSKWQEKIQWNKVKASGIDFAIIRAGYGKESNQIDPYFHENIKGAQSNGIKCGAYWYSYALSAAEAEQEANLFLSTIKGYKLEYPVVLDIEDNSIAKLGKTTCTSIVRAFCNKIEKAGYYATFYTNPNWLKNHLNSDELLNRYDLWLSHWNTDKPSYNCGIWQYSDKGKVDGINGDVDLNYSYKDYESIIKDASLNGFSSGEKIIEYSVKKGDTLWSIAKELLGSGNKYFEIKTLNNLNSNIIYPGQILKIKK